MQQNGEYLIPAPVETVWQALNDPDVLGRCIPGCQEVTKVDETHFDAAVKAKVGPVSATFQASLALEDLQPPTSYRIVGSVKGGAAGFGKGTADVVLSQADAGTRLNYEVQANVGGKLAQVGSRLIDGAARKMADDFFSAFTVELGGSAEQTAADTSPQPGQPDRFESRDQWKIWAVAFVVFALAMLLAL